MGQAATDTEWSHLHLSQIFVELIYIKAEVQMAWISFQVGGNKLDCDTLNILCRSLIECPLYRKEIHAIYKLTFQISESR